MVKIPYGPLALLAERTRYWLTVGISCVPPNRTRSIFVLGYPRTGTNWLCTMLSHYFEMPISEPWLTSLPSIEPVVLHLHRFVIVPRRTIYMMRDPRDIVISHYHMFQRGPKTSFQTGAAQYCDAPLVHENLRTNLPGYIRYLFEGKQPAAMALDRHFRRARVLGLHIARYEDLLASGHATLTGIVEYLSSVPADAQRIQETLEFTSFERHTGRKRGQEDLTAAVARKGIAGDWKHQFSSEAAQVFDRYAGDLLIECGYESDHGWTDRVVSVAHA